jgi:hypothetical protein
VNLLRDGFVERQAEFHGAFGKPLRHLVGTHDTGIIEAARLVRQRAPLRRRQLAKHDRIEGRLHGARAASAERPPAQFRRMFECKSAEIAEDDVVPHLVSLKRRLVILNKVQGLNGLR